MDPILSSDWINRMVSGLLPLTFPLFLTSINGSHVLLSKGSGPIVVSRRWSFKPSSDDIYYIRDLRVVIDSVFIIPISNPTIWVHLVPLKVNCFSCCRYGLSALLLRSR
uniref:Uncharacterized protein n=1 Tax=Lactuca sativa TaxID=4236 RepID=A0A9R1VHC8_LACSA|nr:hypothetical protein LSAT_V11C500270220 [Lactuca sativa]